MLKTNNMMDQSSSIYHDRIKERHNQSQMINETTELLKKREEELLDKLKRTYATEQNTIKLLNDTVKKSPIKYTKKMGGSAVDFFHKPDVAIKKQMPIIGDTKNNQNWVNKLKNQTKI